MGTVYVNAELDYEVKCRYELIVIARDGTNNDGQQTTAVVSIEVVNVNDNPPGISLLFLSDGGDPRISEEAQNGDFVAQISLSDADVGNSDCNDHSSDALVNVTLSGGDGSFELVSAGNNLVTLIVASPPDPLQSYPLRITAIDSGIPPLSSFEDFTIIVSDSNTNPPYFTQPLYTEEILHILPIGSRVLQVEASDVDAIHTPAQLQYSIEYSNQGGSQWFTIDQASGVITTTSTLDCVEYPSPRFNVLAIDSGSPPMTATATVQINIIASNQNQPLFDQSFYNVSINEDISLNACILQVSLRLLNDNNIQCKTIKYCYTFKMIYVKVTLISFQLSVILT